MSKESFFLDVKYSIIYLFFMRYCILVGRELCAFIPESCMASCPVQLASNRIVENIKSPCLSKMDSLNKLFPVGK